ncbi:MAG: hypothetical protein KDD64_02215 [Bdellovibrionales bacterium]|nr:hypothetical protein [Bdellovibrionales bacterium]
MKKKFYPVVKGHHHQNISRHLTGANPEFSKKFMEKNLRFLLSVNYVQTEANTSRVLVKPVLRQS